MRQAQQSPQEEPKCFQDASPGDIVFDADRYGCGTHCFYCCGTQVLLKVPDGQCLIQPTLVLLQPVVMTSPLLSAYFAEGNSKQSQMRLHINW